MQSSVSAGFAKSLPVLDRFVNALPRENYKPVPDSWYVAVTDVIQSRKAIAAGKYKAVNMAGVSMISAIMNAVGHQDLLYIFGGDGAAVAFAEEDLSKVQEALSAVVGWVEDELGLQLRAAVVPVSTLRASGSDLQVAAVRVSDVIVNYAFVGGGIALAEKLMKEGEYRVERADADIRPNLNGLSCRWTPIEEKGSRIVSLIVEPFDGKTEIESNAVMELMELVRADTQYASPMPKKGPGFKWPPDGLALEARATGMGKTLLFLITILAWTLDKTGWPLGKFDPKRYREYTALNTDYRKIQDGIRMTIAMEENSLTSLRKMLEHHRQAKHLKFGICEQDKAVLTCFVPSITSDNHFHFLDGAGGGYAAASDNLS